MYQITKEQYELNLQKRFPNDNFSVLTFINAKSPITIQCNTCKQIFNYNRGTTLYTHNRKYLCRLCNSKSVIAMKEACSKQNISIIESKNNVTEKWKLKCNKCNTEFERAPSTWLKYSCPNCGQANNCYDKQTRQKMVDEKFGEGEFEVLSESAATRHL